MLTLTPREGAAPKVFGPAPHGQGSQISPIMLQEELWGRMRALPYVYMAPTLVSVPHARSLFLPEGVGTGPAEAFQRGREWAHIHPHHDGSLHLTLPKEAEEDVISAGWGVHHPVQAVTLVYGPRTYAELETVWKIIQFSYRYAVGALNSR
ncbi:luciferase family protein [Streptomyces sp. NPDC089915]|uniref:luciferase domain-containing protein n=1 Tax=Streptomyces sp. NPDC089915 TaxID=3155186 RepID=UPI00341E1F51